MTLKTELYSEAIKRLPSTGQIILGHQENEQIVVYQAYNRHIADYAIKNQAFGGSNYSYNRMSWIKPNFLWMMYRCGWASKENQERVLAISISKIDFESILNEATFSSFNPAYYSSHEQWKNEINEKEVRLQWDPDHDPFGNKLARRAIQIGMKGNVLKNFGQQQIMAIEDITEFVKKQKVLVDNNQLDKLSIPIEDVFRPTEETLCKRLGVE